MEVEGVSRTLVPDGEDGVAVFRQGVVQVVLVTGLARTGEEDGA